MEELASVFFAELLSKFGFRSGELRDGEVKYSTPYRHDFNTLKISISYQIDFGVVVFSINEFGYYWLWDGQIKTQVNGHINEPEFTIDFVYEYLSKYDLSHLRSFRCKS